ncbi:hypothetical protein B0I37DRAFT_290624, partial [Chaetomium sp. MPI-CAGE-AT-0009]
MAWDRRRGLSDPLREIGNEALDAAILRGSRSRSLEVDRRVLDLIRLAPVTSQEWDDFPPEASDPIRPVRIPWRTRSSYRPNSHRLLVYALHGQLGLDPVFARVEHLRRRQEMLIHVLGDIQMWLIANPAVPRVAVQRHMYRLLSLAHMVVEPPHDHGGFAVPDVLDRQRAVFEVLTAFEEENGIRYDEDGLPLMPPPRNEGGTEVNGNNSPQWLPMRRILSRNRIDDNARSFFPNAGNGSIGGGMMDEVDHIYHRSPRTYGLPLAPSSALTNGVNGNQHIDVTNEANANNGSHLANGDDGDDGNHLTNGVDHSNRGHPVDRVNGSHRGDLFTVTYYHPSPNGVNGDHRHPLTNGVNGDHPIGANGANPPTNHPTANTNGITTTATTNGNPPTNTSN